MYIERTIDEKVEIVKEYWREGNLSEVARKHNVNRMSIYKWEQLAEDGIKGALKDLKPGKRDVTIEQQNEKLKGQIGKLINVLQKRGDVEIFDEAIFCPKCGSDKIRKNGKLITRKHGLRQKYICNKCSFSFYVGLKKTL
jgi:predicted RNA-binding Zn-ribbon protein involved in translation (DUF1610 family)